MSIRQISKSKCFNGHQYIYEHRSQELGCAMKFAVFLPSCVSACPEKKYPVLYYLSGLTCTEQNFIIKSGFQQFAEKYNIIVINPDTSPRGCNVPGEDESWDFGTGAGFYVDATQAPWDKHYRMYSYVTKELPKLAEEHFPVDPERAGISGHSMGGHGALVCFFKNPDKFKSVSAFAPISNPCKSSWGKKAFAGYLGPDEQTWKAYDAAELVATCKRPNATILVDQGTEDEWMEYLVPNNFPGACTAAEQPLNFRRQEGYDHGYHFVSTFIEDHIRHHAQALSS